MSQPIRILHVVTYMGRGGLETMLMNYYRNIDRTRVQFDFLVHRDFEADYDAEIKELGGKIYRLPKLNPFSMNYHKKLDAFFQSHPEYKIVHVHQDCLSSIALKSAKKNGVPVRISHSHNSNQDKNIKYLIKKFYMRSIPQYATNLFACGKDAGDWMFNGKDYFILNNAIKTKDFSIDENKRNQIREDLGLLSNFVVGHVGRFFYQKNHEFLIDIFNEIYKLNNSSKLLLVGTGDLMDKVKDKVQLLGLDEGVLFLGNRSDVNEIMQAMDVFVFPSHYEGLPVTLVEAQASGLPIFISSNIPGQCKMTDNITSISLEESAQKWAEEILNKTKSFIRKDTYAEIVKAGYDIDSNAKWLEEFYINENRKYK